MKSAITSLFSITLLAIGACRSGSEPATAASEEPAASPPSTFGEQVALGQRLYGEHCADCHGASGEGSDDAPRLVGLDEGALPLEPPEGAEARTGEFRTVADVATFVVSAMPPGAAGSLSEAEYFSILAFDLKANGIDLGDRTLDAELAKTLEIPRKAPSAAESRAASAPAP